MSVKKSVTVVNSAKLADFARRLADQDLRLEVDDAAVAALARAGYDPAYGARPVKRAIQRELETPVARAIVSGRYPPGSTVHVTARDGALVV